jgi:hypothetical protein
MGRRAVDLLRDAGRHRAMAATALAAARQYSSDAVVPSYEALYRAVLA